MLDVIKMPRKRFIDKKNSITFHLVHRSQKDPLIHDDQAPSRILVPAFYSNKKKISNGLNMIEKSQENISLEKNNNESLKKDEGVENLRENVGEAILYGISYDDTKYDYMQHLRGIGKSPGTILLQRPIDKKLSIIDELPKEVFPSDTEQKRSYRDQQSIPDDISGFQPDMDIRLREVLEALEDDRYLSSDEDGDLDELIKSGKADDSSVIENLDTDWDSDDTKISKEILSQDLHTYNNDSIFRECLKNKKKKFRKPLSTATYSSISSSILPRSEALMLLDDRFEKIKKEYDDDISDKESKGDSERMDFESIMDNFLDNYEIVGKKIVPKIYSKEFNIKHSKPMTELDEIRQLRTKI
ncbi:hypothetical protein PNEG_03079 [Pneumocystis murina B123]|uniref:Protein LTV1 n=1 Tax=Pneumocystis murina (strain B123) TaxID=1069680 RepID=M7NJ16_PNEMU|nr:hypothetical protein PNEG_03079 [Pneumocystis murina B123]EMR08603.1 hypothetical protein PNEG_03079 [Pneumocystis murina B123]